MLSFYETAIQINKLLEEDESLSKEKFLNICDMTTDSSLNIYPEDVIDAEVTTKIVGGQAVQTIEYTGIAICSIDTFNNILDYVIDKLLDSVAPFDNYINTENLKNDLLRDSKLLNKLSKFDKDGYEIYNFEEVTFEGKEYIVMEV